VMKRFHYLQGLPPLCSYILLEVKMFITVRKDQISCQDILEAAGIQVSCKMSRHINKKLQELYIKVKNMFQSIYSNGIF
jgi:hypothetical protein